MAFTRDIQDTDQIGASIGVASPVDKPFKTEDLEGFRQTEVDVSEHAPRFLNIGGRLKDLAHVERRAQEKARCVMSILAYPAHLRFISSSIAKLGDRFDEAKVRAQGIPMSSSFSSQELKDPQLMARAHDER